MSRVLDSSTAKYKEHHHMSKQCSTHSVSHRSGSFRGRSAAGSHPAAVHGLTVIA
jgi:hypothetical protein